MSHYLIITGDNCSFCTKAKALLTEQGHSFTEMDVLDAPAGIPMKTVPQVFELVGGFTELETSLGRA